MNETVSEGAHWMTNVKTLARSLAFFAVLGVDCSVARYDARGIAGFCRGPDHPPGAQGVIATEDDAPLATRRPEAPRDAPFDVLIHCQAVRRQDVQNQITADGPGSLSLWVERDLLTKRAGDFALPADGDEELLVISWTDGMRLIGRTADSEGHLSCRIEFDGLVDAQLGHALLHCQERMIVHTTLPVPLARVRCYWMASVPNALARRPEARIAAIQLNQRAIAVVRTLDPDLGSLLCQQRYEADDALEYSRKTGGYQIAGRGRVVMFEHTADPLFPGRPAVWSMYRTDVKFRGGMANRLGTGTQRCALPEIAEYKGDVTFARVGVTEVTIDVEPDMFVTPVVYLAAPRIAHLLELREHRAASPNSHSLYVKAVGGSLINACGKTVSSDDVNLVLPEGVAYSRHSSKTLRASLAQPGSPNKSDPLGHREVAQFDLRSGKIATVDWSASTLVDERILRYHNKIESAKSGPH
jgi:hypothetical protein